MRRSKKLSCKKGGVDCRVSRRERDFRTNHQSSSVLTSSLLFRKARLNIQSNGKEKNLQEKSFTSIFKSVCEFYLPPPTLFFYSHTRHEYFHTQPHTHHPSTMNRAIETYAKISILIARSPLKLRVLDADPERILCLLPHRANHAKARIRTDMDLPKT